MQKMLVTFPAPTGPTTIWSSPYKKKKRCQKSKYILFLSLKHTKIFWYQSMTNDMTISCLVLLKEKIIPLPQPFIAKKQNFTNNDLYSLTHLFIEKHHNNTIHVRSLFAMAQAGSKKAKRPYIQHC